MSATGLSPATSVAQSDSAPTNAGLLGNATRAATLPERLALGRALGARGEMGVALMRLRTAPLTSALGASLASFGSGAGADEGVRCVAAGDVIVARGETTVDAVAGAEHMALLAHDGLGLRPRDVVLAFVPLNAPGVSVEPCKMLGLETATVVRVRIEACRIADAWVVARAAEALRVAGQLWAADRLIDCAILTAALRRALQETLTWTVGRPFMGQRLADMQVVRHRIADLTADYELAAALAAEAEAAWALDADDRVERTAMAAVVCHDTALRVVEGCLQLFGGRGFMSDNWVTRLYRDIVTLRSLDSPAMAARVLAAELFSEVRR